jgi:hypothetical protein
MPEVEPFNLWRWLLFIVGTVYFLVITAQSLYGWYVWLAGGERYISLVRQYMIVQGLRLRFKTFWGDVLICLLLCVAFLLIGRAHVVINDLGMKLADVHRIAQPK